MESIGNWNPELIEEHAPYEEGICGIYTSSKSDHINPEKYKVEGEDNCMLI